MARLPRRRPIVRSPFPGKARRLDVFPTSAPKDGGGGRRDKQEADRAEALPGVEIQGCLTEMIRMSYEVKNFMLPCICTAYTELHLCGFAYGPRRFL